MVTSNAVPIYQDPNYRRTAEPFIPQQSGASRVPLAESNTRPMTSGPIQFKPSHIESSRPLRNVFPSAVYTTMTKVDENLIVVAEEDRFSELDTPSQKNHNSYF